MEGTQLYLRLLLLASVGLVLLEWYMRYIRVLRNYSRQCVIEWLSAYTLKLVYYDQKRSGRAQQDRSHINYEKGLTSAVLMACLPSSLLRHHLCRGETFPVSPFILFLLFSSRRAFEPSGELTGKDWDGPQGALAKIIVLDQFPRTVYR